MDSGSITKIDKDNFSKIYEVYYDELCRCLSFYTRDKQSVEDVIHDVFSNLWRDKDSLELKFVRSYIMSSGRNKMLNLLRNNNKHNALLEKKYRTETAIGDVEDCVDMDEFRYYMERAINRLPDKVKTVFLMSREEGMTYKLISETLNISVKTVEARMGSALKNIKQELSIRYAPKDKEKIKKISLGIGFLWL